ncbi:MAG TPA: PQQ-dependent sugar dehydrogenase [Phycisphaerales bacterium]|nr:PQQ-dependent sugar dehydrogenase [Phycisphaerales bacterium]
MITPFIVACVALAAQPEAKQAEKAERPAAAASGVPRPDLRDIPVLEEGKDYRVETVVEGVEVPWAIAWTSPSRMIFTERPGRVRVVENGKLKAQPLYTVPDVIGPGGENGLMGLCVHPDYVRTRFVYIAYGTSNDVRVVRLKDTGGSLVEPKVIVEGLPKGRNHVGCRIAFGPDKKLYVTAGEVFKRQLAQEMGSLGGKILRVNDDGSIPDDNPFVGQEGKRPEIWSYGHRNPQGIDWDEAGNLYSTEHGPSGEVRPARGDDELNLVTKGADLGWPDVWGTNQKEGALSPLAVFSPAIAPGAAIVYKGQQFPAWRGRVMFCALGGLRPDPDPGVYIVEIKDGKAGEMQRMLTDVGRVRCIAVGPDGGLYVSTSNRDGRAEPREGDDKIVRVVAVEK